MRREDDQKTVGNKNNERTDGVESPSDDLFEIDPADFIDPEEFGFRRKYESLRP